jgi:hypothetical protein
MCSKFKSGCLS